MMLKLRPEQAAKFPAAPVVTAQAVKARTAKPAAQPSPATTPAAEAKPAPWKSTYDPVATLRSKGLIEISPGLWTTPEPPPPPPRQREVAEDPTAGMTIIARIHHSTT